MPITFGSLFAGIGGIDLGLERAGMQCKWQVEIDSYARRVLSKHWPTVRRHDDVKTWPQADTETVDLIAGGFPCQDISYAGAGAGLHGERSGLFFELVRIIRQMEPRIILLENVAALLHRGLGDVLGTLATIGFDCRWDCIPAAAIGAPHIRDRVFIVGYKNSNTNRVRWAARGGNAGCETQSGISSGSDIERFCRYFPNTARIGWQTPGAHSDENSAAQGGEWASESCRTSVSTNTIGEGPSQRQGQPSNAGEEQPTIVRSDWWNTEPELGRVANGIPSRVDRLRGLGNAVVPQIAEWIGRRIMRLENEQ
ncbi:MAG: DNA cytosine methyltransferase [Planctomycetota bacterium]